MKKKLSFILAFALCFTLFCGLTAGAYAADFNVNDYSEVVVYDTMALDVTIEGYTIINTVPGMGFEVRDSGTALYLAGYPTTAGHYTVSGYADDSTNNSNYFEVTVDVYQASSVVELPDVTLSCNAGTAVNAQYTLSESEVSECSCSGSLAPGLGINYTADGFRIAGTPTAEGTYYITVKAYDLYEGQYVSQKVIITVGAKSATLKVTKSPSHESPDAGGSAMFISAAEGYSEVEWRVVTKDGNQCWRGKAEIEAAFPGVYVNIYQGKDGREYMELSDIPLSMNGYYIQTKFWSLDRSTTAFTEDHAALLTVTKAQLKTASIITNPKDSNLESGGRATLTVVANSPDGHSLKFQWYKTSTPGASGGEAIPGATTSNYVPQEIEGTTYYYCAVWNIDANNVSEPVYSTAAAVTYAAAPASSPEPVATPEPTEAPEATPAPSPTPAPAGSKDSGRKDHTALFVIAGLLATGLICGTVIYLKSDADDDDDDDDDYE